LEQGPKFGVIQPNLNPWKKWEAGNLDEQLDIYLDMSKEAVEQEVDMIIWPETALPVYLLSGNYSKAVGKIKNFVDTNKVNLLTGMPDVKFYFDSTKAPWDAKKTKTSNIYYTSFNSVLFFQPDIFDVQRYGKIKLVPFSEKVPFVEYIPILGDLIKWNVGISSWNTGRDTVVFSVDNSPGFMNRGDTLKIAGVVCIESIYPDFIASFVQKGANLIVVVTNDSWYENTGGPDQHKEISVLRAVENRRSLIRAANGGISCFIDPVGRTYSDTEIGTKRVLVDRASILDQKTFYTAYPLLIPVAVVSISLWIIGIFILKSVNSKIKKR
jgi:apolipoprotein N-acyltransferase